MRSEERGGLKFGTVLVVGGGDGGGIRTNAGGGRGGEDGIFGEAEGAGEHITTSFKRSLER